MTAEPASTVPQAPRRNLSRVFTIAGIAAAILCGIALLPQPARSIGLTLVVLPAAIFLPNMLFSAAKLRCPACQVPLPLAFTGSACPSCQAPLALAPAKPAAARL